METNDFLHILITIFSSLAASSGLWMYMIRKEDKKSAHDKMLLGLGHDRITYLGTKYIKRGWVSHEEYESLNDYLYKPYLEMGGNGSAQRIMEQVKKLPIGDTKAASRRGIFSHAHEDSDEQSDS